MYNAWTATQGDRLWVFGGADAQRLVDAVRTARADTVYFDGVLATAAVDSTCGAPPVFPPQAAGMKGAKGAPFLGCLRLGFSRFPPGATALPKDGAGRPPTAVRGPRQSYLLAYSSHSDLK